MVQDIPKSSPPRDGLPFLRILVSFPIACFTCALLTDIAYARTANMMWADFSAWLLAAGMAGGVLAALAGVVSWLAGRRSQPWPRAAITACGGVLTLAIALLDNFVHTRDAWTSVVPMGLTLSAITVLVMMATAWFSAGRRLRRPAAMVTTGAVR